jgi:hypothetical protein
MRIVLAALLLLVQASPAHADATVTVTLNQQGHDLAAELGFSVPELIAHAEARIDELYRISRIDQLLRAFADTAAFSQRGLGADYNGDVAIGTTNALAGSVINLAGLAGVNLSRWDRPRWTVFASGFYQKTTVHNLEGRLLTLAAHAQLQLVQPTPRATVRWTGLAATTGLEYTRWSIGDAGTIVSRFTAQGPAERATVQMDSEGTLDVLTSTFSVPLEVTTGVRFFNVLTLYAGGGTSLTTGSATITAQLDSVLSINSDHLPVGTAVITGSGENTPSTLAVHAIAGLGIHTRHARVFLQGGVTPDERSVMLALRMVP